MKECYLVGGFFTIHSRKHYEVTHCYPEVPIFKVDANTAGLPRASILLDKTFKTLYLCLKAVFGYNTPQDTGLYELTEDIRP